MPADRLEAPVGDVLEAWVSVCVVAHVEPGRIRAVVRPQNRSALGENPRDVKTEELAHAIFDEPEEAVLDPLAARLAELSESVIGASTMTVAESQEVTILADKDVPFIVVRKVMSACTGQGYENVSLAVIQKPAQVAAN